jgi:5'-3' exonuclease
MRPRAGAPGQGKPRLARGKPGLARGKPLLARGLTAKGQPGRMAGVGSLMLLDSASMYFRAFYGVPDTVTASDGTPVNAVRGFLDMITRLVRARRPARLVACMEPDWRPAFRVAAIPSYKAHRANPDGTEQVPEALSVQIPVIADVLAAAGVAMAGAKGYEAVDEAAVTAKYQIPGRDYAAFATLRGDPSDGLPGVPGVGEKSAAALVRVFGSVEAMLTALDAGHGGFPMGTRAKLVQAQDYLRAALPVVRVADDAPVPAVDDRLGRPAGDPQLLADLGERWNLGSSLRRAVAAISEPSAD